MRAIWAPRSQRTAKISVPLPWAPRTANLPNCRIRATSELPRPMYAIACAICSGTRRQSRIHTARLTSWSPPPNRSQTSEALAEQPASLRSSA